MNIKNIFIGSALLLALTGCNMGAQDGAQGYGNGTTGVTYDGGPLGQNANQMGTLRHGADRNNTNLTNRLTGTNDNLGDITNVTHRNQTRNNEPTGDEVLRVKQGYITIDPNAYMTTTPSSKFPHSEQIRRGEFKVYRFGKQGGQGGGQAAAPNQGQGQAQQTPGQQQAPEQATPVPPTSDREQQEQQGQQQQQQPTEQANQGISDVEQRVIELTNAERRKNGLSDLKADASISNVARQKSVDMQQNNYFSHTSPTYGSPFDMMRDFGISYNTAGENIAMGQRTPEEVVNAWMNSEGHRKNILSPNFTHIGVGYTENGHYWTQMFVGR
ncbi:CAP domain-containing protein [Sutcliffiella cohnii]|uniref:CAP domain-containing protein n=1 Tax=Sutcliffiella cohnii TaxID=33932 RepID=UPI000B2B5796|nr:CAP domain-containing protein [Sutcliffiella cohnii]